MADPEFGTWVWIGIGALLTALVLAFLANRFDGGPLKWPIVYAIGTGVSLACAIAAMYHAACADPSTSALCQGDQGGGAPWTLLTAAAAAPPAVLAWYWRVVAARQQTLEDQLFRATGFMRAKGPVFAATQLMEQIVGADHSYRAPVIALLADYVRSRRWGATEDSDWDSPLRQVLWSLGRIRKEEHTTGGVEKVPVDTYRVDRPSSLMHEIDFSGVDAKWFPFWSLYLAGSRFIGANVEGSHFYFADLTSADMEGAILDRCDFHGAILVRCRLRGASLQEANLGRTDLSSADLRDADLRGAPIHGLRHHKPVGKPNFTGANLDGAKRCKDDEAIAGWTLEDLVDDGVEPAWGVLRQA